MSIRKFGIADDQVVTLDDEDQELKRTATKQDWTAEDAKAVEDE